MDLFMTWGLFAVMTAGNPIPVISESERRAMEAQRRIDGFGLQKIADYRKTDKTGSPSPVPTTEKGD